MRRTLLIALAVTLCVGIPAGAATPYNLERALTAQRALAAERPDDATVEVDLGNLLRLADDEAGAEAAYRRAIELDPANAYAHYHLGLQLQARGDRKHALKEYRAALEIDPNYAWAEYQVGTIHHARGARSAALRSYARAFALDATLADERQNPQVIDNELALQAVMMANQLPQPMVEPPKKYYEPARIAALMLDVPPAEGAPQDELATEPAASPEGGGYARASGAQQPGRAGAGAAGDDEDAATARVLTSRNLEPGKATGQITGGGSPAIVGGVGGVATQPEAAPAKPARAPRVRSERPPSSSGATRPSGSIGPVRGGNTGSGTSKGGTKGGGASSGSPSGGGYTPGTNSTGRLETGLVPPGELLG